MMKYKNQNKKLMIEERDAWVSCKSVLSHLDALDKPKKNFGCLTNVYEESIGDTSTI